MHSLDGLRPPAHLQWPRYEGSGNARPARPGCAAAGGKRTLKAGAHGTCGPTDACLICADPSSWDMGRLRLRSEARLGLLNEGAAVHARSLTKAKLDVSSGESPRA